MDRDFAIGALAVVASVLFGFAVTGARGDGFGNGYRHAAAQCPSWDMEQVTSFHTRAIEKD